MVSSFESFGALFKFTILEKMRITITTEDGQIHTLDVDQDMEILNLKALIEADMQFSTTSQQLYHNGNLLSNDKATIRNAGIVQDDILLVRILAQAISQAEQVRRRILADPTLRFQMIQVRLNST